MKREIGAGLIAALGLLGVAGAAHAQIPPAAQRDVAAGLESAQQHHWAEALRHFLDARKLAPNARELYGYLGLTESQMPGRELRAIAWLDAYLAANPQAPNAADVRKRIDSLNAASHTDVAHLIDTLLHVVRQGKFDVFMRYIYDLQVGTLAVAAGDVSQAQFAADQLPTANDPLSGEKNELEREIASAQADRGDLAGAQRTIDLISDAKIQADLRKDIRSKHEALEIAAIEAQAKSGDVEGAWKKLRAIRDDLYRNIRDSGGLGSFAAVYKFLSQEKSIAATAAKIPAGASDWTTEMATLDAPMFTDLRSYLKTISSDNPDRTYQKLAETVAILVTEQNLIDAMLKGMNTAQTVQ